MPFTVKNWEDYPTLTTPLSAAALEDLETRLSAYTDSTVALEASAATYKDIAVHADAQGSAEAVATNLFYRAGAGRVVLAGAASAFCAFRLDPADYAITGRTTKVRVQGYVVTNAVAPAVNYTFSLFPVATWGGGSGVRASVATVGSALVAATINTPGASGPSYASSADATLTAGSYVVAWQASGVNAANSFVEINARLQVRQV